MLWKLTPVLLTHLGLSVYPLVCMQCIHNTCKGGSCKGLATLMCCCKAVENFYNSQLSLEVLLLSTPYMPKKGYTIISPVQYYHTQDKNKTKPERGKNKCNLNAPKQRLAIVFPSLLPLMHSAHSSLNVLMQCIVFMVSQIW